MIYDKPKPGARIAHHLALKRMQDQLNRGYADRLSGWRGRANENLTRGQRFVRKALELGGEFNQNPIIRAIMPGAVLFGDDDISRAARQGASFGFADEITGIVAGEGAKQEARDRADAFRKSHPVLATGAEIAGSLATTGPAAGIGLAKSGLGLLTRGALAGAGSGGLYGFGTAEGGFKERIPEALNSAVWGGAFGAAAPFIPQAAKALAVKPVGRAIMKLLPPDSGTRMRAAQQQALETILTAFTKAGDSLDDAVRKAEAWAQTGAKPETLIELGGDRVKLLARNLFGDPDSAPRKMAQEFFGERQQRQLSRLADDVNSATGVNPANYLDEIDVLEAARKAGDNRAPVLLEAMKTGREVGLEALPPDVLLRMLGDMTEAEVESFGRGYVRGLNERMRRPSVQSDKTELFDSEMLQENMRTLFGDKADDIFNNAARERVMFESNRLAPRVADAGDEAGASLVDVVRSAADAIGEVAKGQPVAMAKSLMKARNDVEVWAALPEAREELAKLLLSENIPGVVQKLAREKLRLKASNAKWEPNLLHPIAGGNVGNQWYEQDKERKNP